MHNYEKDHHHIILSALSSFSQTTVRFINAESNEPVSGIYSYIFKNMNSFVNCGCSNEDGYYTPYILKLDSTVDYQFSLNYARYEPVWKEINLLKHDTLIIQLKRDTYYIADCDSLFSKRSSIYFWEKYTPKRIRSYNDVPPNIATKVKSYLKERVGYDIMNDFNLVDGQIVDLYEFNKYFPGSNIKTSYYLGISYRNLSLGISMYASNLELDENGDIVKDLQFPIVSNDTIPFKFFSLKYIKQKAFKEGFYFPDKTKIDMEYDPERNILLWKFINESNNGHTFEREQILYNSYSGEFIDRKTNKWIMD